MKNAATLLADRLDQWYVPAGRSVSVHRGAAGSSTDPSFWGPFREAVRWLTEIEAALDAMDAAGDDTGHYRESVPAWYRAVFSFDYAWGDSQNSERPAADRRDIALLRALGQSMDSTKYSPRVSSDELTGVREAVDRARQLVVESAIDDAARRYLLGLIAEVLRTIDELEAFGTVHLRDAVFALGGAMHAAAETSVPSAERAAWRDAAQQIVVQLVGGGGAGAIGAVVTQLISG